MNVQSLPQNEAGEFQIAGTPVENYDSLYWEDEEKRGYLRKNWCDLVRVILAVIGISVPVVMYTRPSKYREIIIYERLQPPLDLFLLLDGSGSMQNDWPISLQAAVNITNFFANSYTGYLRVGAGWFGSGSSIIANFSDDIKHVVKKINDCAWPRGTSDYVVGLQLFRDLYQVQRNPHALSRGIIVMVSDGVPSSSDHFAMARLLRGDNYNVSIMGIMVTEELQNSGIAALTSISSCDGVSDDQLSSCPWFAIYSDFQIFQSHAEEVAYSIADEIIPMDVERTEINVVKAPWLGFLALLLPLLAVLIMPYVVNLKRRVRIRRRKPTPAVVYPDSTPSTPLQGTYFVGYPQRRNASQGLVPSLPGNRNWLTRRSYDQLPVQYECESFDDAKVVAPRSVKRILRRLSCDNQPIAVRDLGNGCIEEDYIDRRSLEEWAEDVVSDLWNTVNLCHQDRSVRSEQVCVNQARRICEDQAPKIIEISELD